MATAPWQFGGFRGADETAWVLMQVLFMCAAAGSKRVWLAFLDVQSTFTRPAPAFIFRALHYAGLPSTEWLTIQAILGNLRGCLKMGARLHGEWRVACGVPQGRALSMCLFAIVLVQLYNQLQAAGCGVKITDCCSSAIIAYVDDIVLLAQSPHQLQAAHDIDARWAPQLRMRLNLGIDKSAVMIWGKGSMSAEDRCFQF